VRGFADLPPGLRQLIEASYALSDRNFQLDRAIEVVLDQATACENPVGAQVTRLEEAFGKPRRRTVGL
jgi:regulator of CtrA degradation